MKAQFILSKEEAMKQLEIVQNISDEVSYSVKTNIEVAKVLEGECNFSVHSLQNLMLLEDKSKVWFFAQAWNKELIKQLLDLGVKSFVVDNENDLQVLLDNLDQEINLLLRMKLKEHTIHTGKHFVFGFSSNKINKLIPELKENSKINKLGVHFHRKTQNVSEWSLKEELIDSISEENFSKLDYVNIGGGIPAQYKNFRKEVIDYIFVKIKELKEFLNKKDIKMIIEPGRFIAAPAVKLECEIINIYDNNIIVNTSVYNAAMDTFVANIRLLVENEVENSNFKYVIKGFTPDSLDIFRYSVYLEKEPKIGDKIIFLNAGAYNYSSNYFN
ncbi:decarboxylase, partial [Candidatus Woesearchaeota archaeon]|nr:decarboxylase [Candidatus Woesearchaeota archaeon]